MLFGYRAVRVVWIRSWQCYLDTELSVFFFFFISAGGSTITRTRAWKSWRASCEGRRERSSATGRAWVPPAVGHMTWPRLRQPIRTFRRKVSTRNSLRARRPRPTRAAIPDGPSAGRGLLAWHGLAVMSWVTAGHEIESEAGLCKICRDARVVIFFSFFVCILAYSLLRLAFDLGNPVDLTSWIFIGNSALAVADISRELWL